MTALALKDGDTAVDCTVGAGGHTEALLAAVGPRGRVVGLDRDPSALALARRRLAGSADRLTLVQAPFSELGRVVAEQGLAGNIAGICADLGVSSMHLDAAERGFSFQADGPLDMRMDQTRGESAADLVATLSEDELTRLFQDYGEEPKARAFARAIVAARAAAPITRTAALAEIAAAVAAKVYKGPSRKHPATRVFQALRMAVNDELGELQAMLDQAVRALKPNGRLAVISFHSLEDRVVKDAFIAQTGRRERDAVPRDLPLTDHAVQALHAPKGEVLKPFPMTPAPEEQDRNPRSRSAKLRVLAKL